MARHKNAECVEVENGPCARWTTFASVPCRVQFTLPGKIKTTQPFFFFFFLKDVAFILLEGALCSFVEDFLTQNVDIYNINEVIIQTQTARKVAGTATYKSSKTE